MSNPTENVKDESK